MEREIVFRGKDVETQKWVFGYFSECVEPMDEPVVLTYIKDIENNSFIVYPETVGQYTGLNDKNGKRIFEGDIVKIDDDWDEYGWAAGEKGVIYFENGQFKLKTKVSIFVMDRAFKSGATVLGNIHDNPELLEVQ